MAYAARVLEMLEKLPLPEQLAVLQTAGQQVNIEIGRENYERLAPKSIPDLSQLDLSRINDEDEDGPHV